MDRRNFLNLMAGSGLGALGLPRLSRAATQYNVVIVGGGMAGVTLAKYLRYWDPNNAIVTLIEPNLYYTSHIMSNLVLSGQGTLRTYSYSNLTKKYGVRVIQGKVTSISSSSQTVSHTASATPLSYDRLVLAPGIQFDLMPGVNSDSLYNTDIPHAWNAGSQTTKLKTLLNAYATGSDTNPVIITIPPKPYRCPPGPYERACVIADWLKTQYNKDNRVLVLDANNGPIVEADNFSNAFSNGSGYRVTYLANRIVKNIDVSKQEITYQEVDPSTNPPTEVGSSVTIKYGVLNPIPPQRAPDLLKGVGADLLGGAKFAAVNVLTYESLLISKIHVIGDSANIPFLDLSGNSPVVKANGVPKAGHIANQEAKICADAIIRLQSGLSVDSNIVLNSACYTPITTTLTKTATWLSAVYQVDGVNNRAQFGTWGTDVAFKSAAGPSTGNYSDMNKWFTTLMGDTFV